MLLRWRICLFCVFIFRARWFGFPNSSWFCAVVAEMHSLFYVLFHPLNTLNLWLEDDPNASIVDVLYLFTTFSAFGIWLVFDRYQKAVNSAVPFRHPAPDVRLSRISSTEDIHNTHSSRLTGSRPQLALSRDTQRQPPLASPNARPPSSPIWRRRTRLHYVL